MAQKSYSTNHPVAKTIVTLRGAEPFTTTLAIAEGVGLSHKRVIALVRKYQSDFEEFGKVTFETSLNTQGSPTEFTMLNEDQATYLITLFRNNDIVRGFKKHLVKAFRAALREIYRLSEQREKPEWQLIRDETKLGFKWMNENLVDRRKAVGKETRSHHFQNEARLINSVLSGRFVGLDREALSSSDLSLMAELQRINAMLIAQDMPYRHRKDVLMDHSIRKLGHAA